MEQPQTRRDEFVERAMAALATISDDDLCGTKAKAANATIDAALADCYRASKDEVMKFWEYTYIGQGSLAEQASETAKKFERHLETQAKKRTKEG